MIPVAQKPPQKPKPRISKAFIAAVLLAAATVVPDPKNREGWAIALGIISAAISGGAVKGRRRSTD